VQFVSPNAGHDLARFCFGIGAQAPAAEILNKDRFFNLQTMKALVKSASKTMAWSKTKKAVVWGTVGLLVLAATTLFLQRRNIADWMMVSGRKRSVQTTSPHPLI
jgi:hypothetical protein